MSNFKPSKYKILNSNSLNSKKLEYDSNSQYVHDETNTFDEMSLTVKILIVCCAFIFYGKIIYYLYNIDSSCHCIRDWRYKYAMSMACIILALSFIPFIGIKNKTFITLKTIYIVFSFINAYALYTYIKDLQTTKCACATEKQSQLNEFMVYYRYILAFSMIMSIILLISTIIKNTICKCD
jgi:hypothetical protein